MPKELSKKRKRPSHSAHLAVPPQLLLPRRVGPWWLCSLAAGPLWQTCAWAKGSSLDWWLQSIRLPQVTPTKAPKTCQLFCYLSIFWNLSNIFLPKSTYLPTCSLLNTWFLTFLLADRGWRRKGPGAFRVGKNRHGATSSGCGFFKRGPGGWRGVGAVETVFFF